VCQRFFYAVLASACLGPTITAQQAPALSDSTSLTIYNGNFAVAHTTVDINLKPGLNSITTTQVTAQLEPDSVVLRDLADHPTTIHIIEQNYEIGTAHAVLSDSYEAPMITVPGTRAQMKPTLRWQIQSDKTQNLRADLAYITGGLSWQATYNVIMAGVKDVTRDQRADVSGWVTISNQCGADFSAAHIKLAAGEDKNASEDYRSPRRIRAPGFASNGDSQEIEIGQTALDDLHLYDLGQVTNLGSAEVNQVQILNATGVILSRAYVYDGASANRRPIQAGTVIEEKEYGLDETRTKVKIAEQIKNTSANHLGLPLPPGRVRLYRQGADGQIELIGDSLIPHTAPEGSINIVADDALDVSGVRSQTDFNVSGNGRTVDESIRIKVINQKSEPIAVAIAEHLYRGNNWEVTEKSADYTKIDSHTIQFPIQVPARGQSDVSYSVRYSW
jgi:hypothetical protein